ncbi:MAG: hypothetical protein LN413_06940 [Candidatus Thermoplasmatota archaeon]|nr:hypothetical protein [Candidatus Thermoplasmatota archaeon]
MKVRDFDAFMILAKRISDLEDRMAKMEAYVASRRAAVPGEHKYGLR